MGNPHLGRFRLLNEISFVVLSVWLSIAGCEGQAGQVECASTPECSAGFICVDGTCVVNVNRPDVGRRDAGSPFIRDAGGRDAGRPGYDAGAPRFDAGRLGAGRIDAGTSIEAGPQPLDGSICGPAACATHNAECGSIEDACGADIECGQCNSGYTCGAQGTSFANRCRCSERCEPNQCGTISICGAMMNCGGCGNGQECGDDNECCSRRTCEQAGAQCGNISDGCGRTLDCGNSCSSPESCGGGGTPNRCGCKKTRRWTSLATFSRARNLPQPEGLDWLNLNQGVQFDAFGSRVICPSRPVAQISDYLYLTNANLNVPSNATIVGVEVAFSIRRDGTDPIIRRVNLATDPYPAARRVSINRARPLGLTNNFEHRTFGGEKDTWSLRLTPADVNHPDFGVRIGVEYAAACAAPGTQVVVDAAEIRVRYEVCR